MNECAKLCSSMAKQHVERLLSWFWCSGICLCYLYKQMSHHGLWGRILLTHLVKIHLLKILP